MCGQPGQDTRYSQLPPSFLGMDDLTTERSQLCGLLICLAYFFDMLSKGVCTTRHLEASGQLVQELDVSTVLSLTG